jgi:hypothetical protein
VDLYAFAMRQEGKSGKEACFLLKQGLSSRPGTDATLADPRPLAGVSFYIGFHDAGNLAGNSIYIPLLVAAEPNR